MEKIQAASQRLKRVFKSVCSANILRLAYAVGRISKLERGDRGAMKFAQFDKFPPSWLDFERIRGKQRYKILGDLDWHFWCDIPAARDYSLIESRSKALIEQAIDIAEKH